MITKTAIGNYLRKQPNGDVGMYRNGFKDGVQWAQKRLAQPPAPDCRTCEWLPECSDGFRLNCFEGNQYKESKPIYLWGSP